MFLFYLPISDHRKSWLSVVWHRWRWFLSVPADGVKGKTWGPSTCHQRERGQISLLRPAPRPGGIWSKSAPNLDKTRTAAILTTSISGGAGRPNAHDLGNAPATADNKSLAGGDRGDNMHTTFSTLQLFKSKVTAFALSEFRPFRAAAAGWRNNSLPADGDGGAALTPGSVRLLSRSIGNISESHYDTVFSTNSFVIARGVSNNNCVEIGKGYGDLSDAEDDTQKLLKD